MTILKIDSSITGENSVSRVLTRSITEQLIAANPGISVIERDLVGEPLDHLTLAAFDDSAVLDYRLVAAKAPHDPPRLLAVLQHRRRLKILTPEGLAEASVRLPIDGYSTVSFVEARSVSPAGPDSQSSPMLSLFDGWPSVRRRLSGRANSRSAVKPLKTRRSVILVSLIL